MKLKMKYYCVYCGKECNGIGSFYNHIKKHNKTKKQYFEEYNINDNLYKCKECGIRLVSVNKTYCSNACKYNDVELNKKRVRKIQNDTSKQMRCNICNKIINDTVNASGNLTAHLKTEHDILDINYNDYFTLEVNQLKLFKCPYCNWTTIDLKNNSGGFTKHLKNEHNLTPTDYVSQFPHHKYLWKMYFIRKERIDFINKDTSNRVQCKVCGSHFKKITQTHLKTHDITTEQYKLKYHTNKISSINNSKKQSNITTKHNLLHGSSFKSFQSALELDFKTKLKNAYIDYKEQYLFNGKKYDFKIYNLLVEIDGTYYHPAKLEKLSLTQISSAVNDNQKMYDVTNSDYTLYKIHWDVSMIFESKSELINLLKNKSYIPNYLIHDNQIIIAKSYIQSYIKNKGINKLHRYDSLIIKFIKMFMNILISDVELHTIINIILCENFDLTRNNIQHIHNQLCK